MATRVVNGSTSTEDGWPLVDQAGCTWVTIPGCNPPVTIQAQTGIPAILFRAWTADLNAFVEKVRDADTGSWTEGNSVLGGYGQNNGSNHLGGTAEDVNWGDHPMGPAYAGYTQDQIDEIRRMREFYKLPDGTYLIFWAEDWDTPKDSMHFQLGYGTYERQDAINAWIRQNMRPDGFSTYRRGAAPAAPMAEQVLCDATGLPRAKANEIIGALRQGLQLAECTTVNRIAMFIAETREESDDYNTTVEYGDLSGEAFYPYIGRTWIQITWQSNYAAFGKWCADNGLISDSNQFVNDPESLADIKWAGIGAAWYWKVQRPQINSLCDQGNVTEVTRLINGGTSEGAPTWLSRRRDYWNQALAQGDALLALTNSNTGDDDEMAGWTPELVNRAMILLENQTGVSRPSLSPLHWPGEGKLDTDAGFAQRADGSLHILLVEKLAVEYGDIQNITLLWVVANKPDATNDPKLAASILAKVDKAHLDAARTAIQAWLDAEAAK